MPDDAKKETAAEIGLHLQDLVLDSSDVGEFLNELAAYSADSLSKPGLSVYCGCPISAMNRAGRTTSMLWEVRASSPFWVCPFLSASNSRNIKLRDVAAGIISSITEDAAVHTHFDE